MASIEVWISSDNYRTVNPDSVSFTVGDSITISAAADAPSILTFSSAAASILAPTPDPRITVTSAQAQKFTFDSAEPGTYTIAVADAQFSEPIDNDSADAQPAADSTATLQFVVLPIPVLMPPPVPVTSVGPIFHPNSGG